MVHNVTMGHPTPLRTAVRPLAGEGKETQTKRAEVDARQILARLLGTAAGDPLPVRKAMSVPAQTDEFAPHLGRYLDVTA